MDAHGVATAYQSQHSHEARSCRIRCPVHGTHDSGNHCAIWNEDGEGVGVFCHSRQCDTIQIRTELAILKEGKREQCGVEECRSSIDDRVAVYDHSDGGQRCVHRLNCIGEECSYPKCDGSKNKHIWGPGSPKGTHIRRWGDDDSENVLVFVEGEKAAQALLEHGVQAEGFTPVSWRGGAGKERMSVYERARGRVCHLWPDADEQGIDAMRNVADELQKAGADLVCMIDVSELPEKADAADVDAATALAMIADPPDYETPTQAAEHSDESPASTGKPKPKSNEIFGIEGFLSYSNPRARSSDADAVRLLMFCPENLLVSLGEDDESTLYVCDPKTGLWVYSKMMAGLAVNRSIEAWHRGMDKFDLGKIARDRVVAWGRTTSSERGRDALRSSLSTALAIIQSENRLDELKKKGLTVCHDEDLNADTRFLGALNGVVDLEDGKLLTPKQGRGKLITLSTGINYKPFIHLEESDHTEAVERLTFHLEAEEEEWIKGYLGHALWGKPEGWAWLVGAAESGKTTLIEAVHAALGDYATAIPSKMFKKQPLATAHDEGLQLFMGGIRIAIASDILSNVDLEADVIKRVATGDIDIGRRTHGRYEGRGDSFTASMILAFNEGQTPKIDHMDEGFRRRLRVLRYPRLDPSMKRPRSFRESFKNNTSLREHVLSWLIECAMRHKTIPESTPEGDALLDDLRREDIGEEAFDWLIERIERTGDDSDKIGTGELWEVALKEHGEGEIAFGQTQKSFTRIVRRTFAIGVTKKARIRGETVNAFWGLRWKGQEQPKEKEML